MADNVNVNKFMGTSSSTTAAPAAKERGRNRHRQNHSWCRMHLAITLNARVGTVQYDNINLSNVNASLAIRDQAVSLQSITANALDGSIKMSGSYSTKTDKKNPDIQFAYTLNAVDIQKTFNTFNTVQKLMPVGKYVSGKVNLTMTGKLGGDMSPVMNSLAGKGDLMVLNGLLSNFPVTNMLADKLKLQQFKSMKVDDMKLFFKFENGRVSIDPYKTKIGDIEAGDSRQPRF